MIYRFFNDLLFIFKINGKNRMHFFYYITEIRYRIFYLVFSYLITFVFCYYYSLEVIYFFVKPFLIFEKSFIFTDLTEGLSITLKICTVITTYIIIPFFFYQVWSFILPSCYPHEKKKWTLLFFFSILLILVSISLVYSIILPQLCSFLLNFEIKQENFAIQLEARIHSYVEWTIYLFLLLSFLIQLPLLFYFFSSLHVLDPVFFSKNRKFYFCFSLLVAAFLSPPDLLSQWVLTFFFALWIEFMLWLSYFFAKIKE